MEPIDFVTPPRPWGNAHDRGLIATLGLTVLWHKADIAASSKSQTRTLISRGIVVLLSSSAGRGVYASSRQPAELYSRAGWSCGVAVGDGCAREQSRPAYRGAHDRSRRRRGRTVASRGLLAGPAGTRMDHWQQPAN